MRRVAEIEGRRLSLSNLEKDLYPSYGFTKAQILEYYQKISPFILPHLKDRALTLKRFPDGVAGEYFYEKRCPSHRPAWVATAEVVHGDGERMTACLANDLNTLIWVENLASIELHVPLSKAATHETPDSIVFDLDPGERTNVLDCARVALIIRDLLVQLRLACYVKTSGQKGLHVFVPLNRTDTTFVQAKKFSKTVADVLQRNYPNLVTARMAKEERKGRVFINWAQNDSKKTMICVYSLRARERPTVSFPLAWDELEYLAGQGEQEKFQVLHSEALARTKKNGDPFLEVLVKQQKLPYL